MKLPALTSSDSKFLLGLALFGLLVPNGVFLWYAIFSREVVFVALSNPVALVFAFEAFALMFLFAWLIHRAGVTRPGWKGFILLSLIGSMLFSVPLVIRRVLGFKAAHFDSAQ
jgi:hypothetical protein